MTTSRSVLACLALAASLLAGCIKRSQPPEPEPPPRTRDTGVRPEALWSRMQAELTVGNHDSWFSSLSDEPEVVSEALVRLLDESVGSCSEWVTESCDDHHHGKPIEPGEDASIEDECAAQIIFVDEAHRITAEDRLSHATSLARLPTADLGKAEELLMLALELAPFETAVEDYALLAVHERGREGDEELRESVEAVIEARPEAIRHRAYRALAAQREDPVTAMWAARSLAAAGDSQFLPHWTPDASLDDVAFLVHMAGALGEPIPAELVSKQGMTVREVVSADAGTLERFDPPRETLENLAWAPTAEFPAPWDDSDHLDATATRTKCSEDEPEGPRCTSEVDGAVTIVGFERQAGGGYKVRTVTRKIGFPDCML